ncbi:MAG: DUF2520 domain-containing protein [Microbacterium sp.]|uniref:DUF2520 domain-containing protein n=1 Tax=Microbacterium sp. TaxID=51671 RepID=UPI003A86DB26
MPESPATARPTEPAVAGRIVVVGAGRMGTALVTRLREAGLDVRGSERRGETAADAAVVLLAVPDAAITDAADAVVPGRLVGHVSGATTLDPLTPHEAFSMHPLMTVTGADAHFEGVSAAIAGTTPRAAATATALARALGMTPTEVADTDRVAYHAAASMASNFLVTLEHLATSLAATAGVDRAALVPLVRASVENWAAHGAHALTGPIVRGDDDVVAAQRRSVAERMPDALSVFDALAEVTRAVAASTRPANPAHPAEGAS